jgi:hypothetical protein
MHARPLNLAQCLLTRRSIEFAQEVFNREIYLFYNLPNYTKPGEPIILYNVYDAATAHLIASNPVIQAVACSKLWMRCRTRDRG